MIPVSVKRAIRSSDRDRLIRFLSGKPEERRELLMKLRNRKIQEKKSSSRKNLEEERQNLVRVEDILSNFRKQVDPLREQSEKAKEYLAYRDELDNLDINLYLERI